MSSRQRDTTLADYLRVLRGRRLFIVLVAVICAAAGLGVSLLQKPTYDATASLAVNDPNQDLSLLGSALVSNQTPLQLASIHAPQVTRPSVVTGVKAQLHGRWRRAALIGAVSVGIDPNSFLVTIDAQSRHPAEAAAIANAFAHVDAALTTAQDRRAYARAASGLTRKLRKLPAATNPSTRSIYTQKLAELQSLASIATPVQISKTATVPGSPSSPKTVRNVLAALIFGLLLGIALAYGREAFDHRLRRSAEVEEQFDYPVLGQIRAAALARGHDRGRSQAGRALDDVDAESFRILRHNVRYMAPGDDARTLLVTSAMAQEGKSTVAAGLAKSIAEGGRRTLLIECDLRRPSLAAALGIAAQPGLADYLVGEATPEQITQVISLGAASSNGSDSNGAGPARDAPAPLVCITAGTPPSRPADLLVTERFREFLAEVSEAYESVIVDSPPLLPVADTLEIVPRVSGILVCVRLGQTTREQAQAARAALDRLGPLPTGVVLTDVKETEIESYGYHRSDAGTPAAADRASRRQGRHPGVRA